MWDVQTRLGSGFPTAVLTKKLYFAGAVIDFVRPGDPVVDVVNHRTIESFQGFFTTIGEEVASRSHSFLLGSRGFTTLLHLHDNC
jgi:hypothetical protein